MADEIVSSYLPQGNVIYQQTAPVMQTAEQAATAPRGLNQLLSDPTFVSSAAPIRDEMFNQWLNNDFQQMIQAAPENQRAGLINRAKQIYTSRVQQPEQAGMIRSIADNAVTFGNSALDATGAIARAFSPENRFSQAINDATDWSRKNLLSQETQETQLARQQRLERAQGVLGGAQAVYQNIKDAPLNSLADFTGSVAPAVVGAAAAAAAAPAVGISALAAGTGGGIAAGGLSTVGDIRGIRSQTARNLTFDELSKSPEVQTLLKQGYTEQQIRDALANEMGWQEGLGFVANAIPGGALGRLVSKSASGAVAGKLLSGSAGRALSGRVGAGLENAALGALGGGVEGGAGATIQAQYNPLIDWTANATSGALLGGIAGGTLGSVLGSNHGREDANIAGETQADTTTTTPNATTTATTTPPSGGQQFTTPRSYINALKNHFSSETSDESAPSLVSMRPIREGESPVTYTDKIFTDLRRVSDAVTQRQSSDLAGDIGNKIAENVRNQKEIAAKNFLDNLVQEALKSGDETPTGVGEYVGNQIVKLNPDNRVALLSTGALNATLTGIREGLSNPKAIDDIVTSVSRVINNATTHNTSEPATTATAAPTGTAAPTNPVGEPTGSATNNGGDNTPTGPATASNVLSGNGTNDTTQGTSTVAGDGTINPSGASPASSGSGTVTETEPVYGQGRGAGNTGGETAAPEANVPTRADTQPSTVANPVATEQVQPTNAASIRPSTNESVGGSPNPRSAGVEPNKRSGDFGKPRVVRNSVQEVKEKNSISAKRTEAKLTPRAKKNIEAMSEISSRIDKLPPVQKEALETAARENGSLFTPIFVQEAFASKVTADKTLWNSLKTTVKRAINNVMKGLSIVLAAVSFNHMRPVEARADTIYTMPQVVESIADPKVNSVNSWVRELNLANGKKYVIADTSTHDLYVMNPDGTMANKMPMMSDGTQPQAEPMLVQAADGSGKVSVTELETPNTAGQNIDNMTLIGDSVSLPADASRDLLKNFDGKVFEVSDADQPLLTNDTNQPITADAIVDTVSAVQSPSSSPLGSLGGTEAGLGALLPLARRKKKSTQSANAPEGGDTSSKSPSGQTSTQTTEQPEAVAAELGKGIPGAATTIRQVKSFTNKVLNKFDKTESRVVRTPSDVNELLALSDTGALPKVTSKEATSTWSKIRTTLTDHMEPFFRVAGEGDIRSQYFIDQNRYFVHGNDVRDVVGKINTDVGKVGSKHGYSARTIWELFNTFLRGYVAEDMNNAAYKQHSRRAKELEANMPELKRDSDDAVPGAAAKYDAAQKELLEINDWISDFNKFNNTVRSSLPEGDIKVAAEKAKFVGGITTAEGKAILDGSVVKKLSPEFTPLADRLLGLIKNAIDYAVEKGVMSDTEAQYYYENGKYIPTTGKIDADNSSPDMVSWAGGSDRSRDGRISLSDNPVQTVLSKVSRLYYRADMAGFYNKLINNGKDWGFRIKETTREAAPPNTIMVTRSKTRENGETYTARYIIANDDNPEAMSALTGANIKYQTNAVLRRAAQWTFGFSYAVTRLVPAFGFTNGFRDIGERVVNITAQKINGVKVQPGRLTVAAYKNYLPSVKTAFQYLSMRARGKEIPSSGPIAELHKLVESGGVLTRNRILTNNIRGQLSSMRPLTKAMGGIHKTFEAINLWNEAFETAASLAVYKALRAQNVDHITAASTTLQAMNLNQRGTAAPFMNVLYPFFSTRMVGADNIIKSLSSRRGLAIFGAQIAASVVLYEMVKAMAGDETDEAGNNVIDQLSDSQIARTIPIFDGNGIIRVPVPYGLSYLAWNVGTAIARYTSGRDTGRESTEHALQAFADELIPAGSPPPSSPSADPFFYSIRTLTPEFLRRFVNIAANKNDFGDTLNKQEIVDTKPRNEQGRASTPDFWKQAAKLISPLHDMTPEEVKELAGFVVPPISAIVSDADRSIQDGDSPEIAASSQILGVNRVYSVPRNTLNNIFFPALRRAEHLQRDLVAKYGDIPTAEETGIRSAETRKQLWLNKVQLTPREENIIRALFEEQSLRAKHGANKIDEDEIKRTFLRRVGNAT